MNLQTIIKQINKFLMLIAASTLIISMVEAVINMVLRRLGQPIQGSFEIMSFACAIISTLGLGYSQEQKAHINVDIIFRFFPIILKKFLRLIGNLMCSLFFLAISLRLFSLSMTYFYSGQLSETLRIPIYPITFLVGMGFVSLSLTLLLESVILVINKD